MSTKAKAEFCAQCQGEAQEHPVVCIMNVKDVASLNTKHTVVGVDPGKAWAAVAVCPSCHKQPRLKGHFHMRADATIALRLADMHTVAMPRQVR